MTFFERDIINKLKLGGIDINILEKILGAYIPHESYANILYRLRDVDICVDVKNKFRQLMLVRKLIYTLKIKAMSKTEKIVYNDSITILDTFWARNENLHEFEFRYNYYTFLEMLHSKLVCTDERDFETMHSFIFNSHIETESYPDNIIKSYNTNTLSNVQCATLVFKDIISDTNPYGIIHLNKEIFENMKDIVYGDANDDQINSVLVLLKRYDGRSGRRGKDSLLSLIHENYDKYYLKKDNDEIRE